MNLAKQCTIEYDGASKGNPGTAGAGFVLRDVNGNVVMCGHQGLGIATNNEAEYAGLIKGMQTALKYGFTSICVQGDSELVHMQIQGYWTVRSPNLRPYYNKAIELKNQFGYFESRHVLRAYNSVADAQANMGTNMREGAYEQNYY